LQCVEIALEPGKVLLEALVLGRLRRCSGEIVEHSPNAFEDFPDFSHFRLRGPDLVFVLLQSTQQFLGNTLMLLGLVLERNAEPLFVLAYLSTEAGEAVHKLAHAVLILLMNRLRELDLRLRLLLKPVAQRLFAPIECLLHFLEQQPCILVAPVRFSAYR
jgi:hypothetical protein